jgi:hypothetical protein
MAVMLNSRPPVANAEEEKDGGAQKSLQQRIDFGNAYVLGQSIKSGAVYLLHRKQSELEGMIDVRVHYRDEIMEDYSLEETAIVSANKGEQGQSKKEVIRETR